MQKSMARDRTHTPAVELADATDLCVDDRLGSVAGACHIFISVLSLVLVMSCYTPSPKTSLST